MQFNENAGYKLANPYRSHLKNSARLRCAIGGIEGQIDEMGEADARALDALARTVLVRRKIGRIDAHLLFLTALGKAHHRCGVLASVGGDHAIQNARLPGDDVGFGGPLPRLGADEVTLSCRWMNWLMRRPPSAASKVAACCG